MLFTLFLATPTILFINRTQSERYHADRSQRAKAAQRNFVAIKDRLDTSVTFFSFNVCLCDVRSITRCITYESLSNRKTPTRRARDRCRYKRNKNKVTPLRIKSPRHSIAAGSRQLFSFTVGRSARRRRETIRNRDSPEPLPSLVSLRETRSITST